MDILSFHFIVSFALPCLLCGIFSIAASIKMRHEKPGVFSPKKETEMRHLYLELLEYPAPEVESKIQQRRYETENQDPRELRIETWKWVALRSALLFFGVCNLSLLASFFTQNLVLNAVGFFGFFSSTIVGALVASIYTILKYIFQWPKQPIH